MHSHYRLAVIDPNGHPPDASYTAVVLGFQNSTFFPPLKVLSFTYIFVIFL